MLPRIIIHNAVSADGRIDWFPLDVGLYYSLVTPWEEDATLAGSDTILHSTSEVPADTGDIPKPAREPLDRRPLLVIPDSKGRVRIWRYLLTQPYWRGGVALCSRTTPREYLDYLRERYIDYIIAGDDQVDLRAALEELNGRHYVRTVRVDSGGVLNGVLLREGLVDEVSLMIQPSLVGGTSPRSFFRAPDLTSAEGVIPMKLTRIERLEDDIIRLRYEIEK